MKVLINFLCSDEQTVIKIDSRPNVGDGIYLDDFKELKGLSDQMRKRIVETTRFVVTDVVYGMYGPKEEHKKLRWIIQGELQD
jgi:hypothetical protein